MILLIQIFDFFIDFNNLTSKQIELKRFFDTRKSRLHGKLRSCGALILIISIVTAQYAVVAHYLRCTFYPCYEKIQILKRKLLSSPIDKIFLLLQTYLIQPSFQFFFSTSAFQFL